MALQLRKLVIHQFRNIRPGTELTFAPGLQVILGKNGTGKTTLLDLIAAVASLDPSRIEEIFHITADLSDHNRRVQITIRREPGETILMENDPNDITMDGLIENSGVTIEFIWRIGTLFLTKESRKTKIPCPVPDLASALVVLLLEEDEKGVDGLFENNEVLLTTENAKELTLRLISTLRRYIYRHDEGIRMMEDTLHNLRLRWISAKRLLIPRHQSAMGSLISDYVSKLASSDTPLTISFSQLGLQNLCAAIGARNGYYKLSLEQANAHKKIATYSLSLYFEFPDGSQKPLDFLSYGQQRMISLFWYLAVCPDIVCLDEPVNGLHHEMLEQLINELDKREQSFVTSQNPLFLDYLQCDSLEKVQNMFILCRSHALADGQTELEWRRMTDEEAAQFFGSVQTGIQYVSEVLISQGLW